MNVTEAIQIIHDANGKAIWAHPFDILNFVVKERIDENKVDLICQRLKVLGIDGIEVYYEPFTLQQQDFLKEMQYKYGFISSTSEVKRNRPDLWRTFDKIDCEEIKIGKKRLFIVVGL